MRDGADGTDDYLSAWRRAAAGPCGDDLATEAAAKAAAIEQTTPSTDQAIGEKWWPDVSLTALRISIRDRGINVVYKREWGGTSNLAPCKPACCRLVKPIRVTRQKRRVTWRATLQLRTDMAANIDQIKTAAAGWSIEVTPTGAQKIDSFDACLAPGSTVNITFLPGSIRWILSRWQSGYIRMA